MRKGFVLFSVIFIGFLVITAAGKGKEERIQGIKDIKTLDLSVKPQDIQSTGMVKPDLNFGKFPLYFIYNKGQVNEKAKFYAKASRYTLWLTKEGLVFDSTRRTENPKFEYRNPMLLCEVDRYVAREQIQNPNFQNSKQKQIPVGNSPLTTHQSLGPPSHKDTKRVQNIKKAFIIHRTNSSLIIYLLTRSFNTNEMYRD